MKLYVSGVGVLGPGLQGWPATKAVLSGAQPYEAVALSLQAPTILPPRERRRSSPAVRLALNVAQEAVEQSGVAATELAAVFGSSNGNGREIHLILDSLTKPGKLVSPTHFHNSVHNAAVGYWCIATGCHLPSTSIACYDFTFPATLLKSAAQVVTEQQAVLLSVFDFPLPEPLQAKRPIEAPFAAAFVLTPEKIAASQSALTLTWQGDAPEPDSLESISPNLRALWQGNPAGRALPLLEALALGTPKALTLRYPEQGHIELDLVPC